MRDSDGQALIDSGLKPMSRSCRRQYKLRRERASSLHGKAAEEATAQDALQARKYIRASFATDRDRTADDRISAVDMRRSNGTHKSGGEQSESQHRPHLVG